MGNVGFLMRIAMSLSLLILLALLLASFFYPKIDKVIVNNNVHYSKEEIMKLANVEINKPFFWLTTWSAAGLIKDPWIKDAKIYKRWPSTVSISVSERKPILTNGFQNFAIDGTILSNVSPEQQKALIQLDGWGEPRLDEILKLVNLFDKYELEKISYVPSGLTVKLAKIEVFTPSVEMLKIHWGSFLSQVGKYKKTYVYPWGVSGSNE